MRNKFDEQLVTLNNSLIEMGGLVERALQSAIRALKYKDAELAQETVSYQDEIDDKERDIESLCLKLLMEQQPVARDLRIISSALKMVTDMERIGDNAADIAEVTLRIIGKDYIKELEHIPKMTGATTKMVTQSIDAFVKKDLELAQKVVEYDDVVDDLFDTIKKELIDLIREDRDSGEQAIDFLMIGKYLERIGDHAGNIAKWVAFSITGELQS